MAKKGWNCGWNFLSKIDVRFGFSIKNYLLGGIFMFWAPFLRFSIFYRLIVVFFIRITKSKIRNFDNNLKKIFLKNLVGSWNFSGKFSGVTKFSWIFCGVMKFFDLVDKSDPARGDFTLCPVPNIRLSFSCCYAHATTLQQLSRKSFQIRATRIMISNKIISSFKSMFKMIFLSCLLSPFIAI